LRESLMAVVGQLDPGLPNCLPILGAALLSRGPDPALPPADHVDLAGLPLSAMLSRALLSFALEYERDSGPSLAIGANVLRVLGTDGTRLRDLPSLTGTSKEAVNWALGILIRGLQVQRLHHEFVGAIEQRWRGRFTTAAIDALRTSLEALATAPDGEPLPLFGGLEPYPGNWRAAVRRPAILPYYPMVLHRGGYPDGS
jgi:hypothetical protein